MKIKTLRDSFNSCFKDLLLNKNIPSLNPIPKDRKIAESSNNPWGRSLHNSKIPACFIVIKETNPKIYPFVMLDIMGNIPKKIPKRIERKAILMLFEKIK